MRIFLSHLVRELRLRITFWTNLAKLSREIFQIKKKTDVLQLLRGLDWIQREFSSPAPNFVKWDVLKRWGSRATWIETGTYLGETTEFLSKIAQKVISIEPSLELASLATEKFGKIENTLIVLGTSEDVLEFSLQSLDEIDKSDINFWLDGHYSEGITYLGELACPVPEELSIIRKFLRPSYDVTIFIDDIRTFSPTGQTINGYPSLSYLANWADESELSWTIEHDIFIMTNRILS